MMASFEKALPVEKWEQVFSNVSHRDLCNVMLTSHHMKSVASWPEFWVGMKINRKKVCETGLAEFNTINRFRRIKEMNFTQMNFTAEELERLLNDIRGSSLENVNFRCVNFRKVSPDLLAPVVSHLNIVNLACANMTTSQSIKALEAILASRTQVNVDLGGINLSDMPAELLAEPACQLQIVRLCSSTMTTTQCTTLWENNFVSSTLVNLDLGDVDLSEVPSELLAESACRLQTVRLCSSSLTTDQCIKLLETSLVSTTVAHVNFGNVDLSNVPPDLLAMAVFRLHTVNLQFTKLTTKQCVKVLEASITSTALVNMSLGYVNLRQVPPELLAKPVGRLQTVNLQFTKLTTGQCDKLIEAIRASTTLMSLDLRKVNLSGVAAKNLARAVGRLRTVNLWHTSLTTVQFVQVLKEITASTTLRHVDLTGNQVMQKLGYRPMLPTNVKVLIETMSLAGVSHYVKTW